MVPGGEGVKEVDPIAQASGADASASTKRLRHLRIGDLVLSPAPLTIANLTEFKARFGAGPGGLLSSELLRSYWLVLDLGNHTLYAARRRPG